jgi:hypothetical protein
MLGSRGIIADRLLQFSGRHLHPIQFTPLSDSNHARRPVLGSCSWWAVRISILVFLLVLGDAEMLSPGNTYNRIVDVEVERLIA